MPQSINKLKIYFYIFSLLFLTTIINKDIISNISYFFIIKNLNIVSETDLLKKKILKEINFINESNIFFIKKKKLSNKLKNINYIDEFKIKKIYPSSLIVQVKKTNLIGITFINNKQYYVGENGNFISVNSIRNKDKLPFIFGEFNIQDFLNLKLKLSDSDIIFSNIKKYHYHKNRRWDLYLNDNVLIQLPNKNIKNALNLYKKLKTNNEIKPNMIIDLRIPNRIILNNG
jgi:cell division protein FtsQ